MLLYPPFEMWYYHGYVVGFFRFPWKYIFIYIIVCKHGYMLPQRLNDTFLCILDINSKGNETILSTPLQLRIGLLVSGFSIQPAGKN